VNFTLEIWRQFDGADESEAGRFETFKVEGMRATPIRKDNTQGRPGAFNKSITITSNADTPEKIIYIKGEVVKAEPEKSVPVEQPSLLAPKN